jgi:hypothetical protein
MRDVVDGVDLSHVDSGDRFRDPRGGDAQGTGRIGPGEPDLRHEVHRELRSHRRERAAPPRRNSSALICSRPLPVLRRRGRRQSYSTPSTTSRITRITKQTRHSNPYSALGTKKDAGAKSITRVSP